MEKLHMEVDGLSRRGILKSGAAIVGGAMLTPTLTMPLFAADQPPIGTWPDGSSGSSVFIGITVPRTGTYAVRARTSSRATSSRSSTSTAATR